MTSETKRIHFGNRLVSWQADVVQSLKDYPQGNIFVIKSMRQVGKSYLLARLLINRSVNFAGSVSYYISPTLKQSRKIYKDICDMLRPTPVITKKNDTLLECNFINGSMIYFLSAEQRESLRGYTCKKKGLLVIDEGAFIDDDIYAKVFPYTNVHKNNIVITSTPAFRSGMFYDLFTTSENNIHTFDVCDYDTSMFLGEEQRRIYQLAMPTQKYNAEILGQWMDEFSAVFGDFSHACSNEYDVNDNEFFVGIDWGTGGGEDSTVIVVMNSKAQMVDLIRFNDKDSQQTIEEVVKVINRYKPKNTIVEMNSIGKVFYDLLVRRTSVHITRFVTTNDTKRAVINNLQIAIQNGDVQLLDNVQLKVEFANYEVEKTHSGKVTYNAKSGNHDDIVMATAFAYSITKANKIHIS